MNTSRRVFLLSTAALAVTGTSTLPSILQASESKFQPWQAEIDSMFELFDAHSFTQRERQLALFIRPLMENLGDTAIRDVLTYELPKYDHKRERLSLILSIKHSLESQHGPELAMQRAHMVHQWSDNPVVSIRHLMTTGDRGDLHDALLCSKVRV